MRRNYIGLANTYHDSAIAIVDHDGNLVFAEGTERYTQNKRAFHCPADVYARLRDLVAAHLDRSAETVVALTWTDRSAAELSARLETQSDEPPEGASPFERLVMSKVAYIDRSQLHAQRAAGLGLQAVLDRWDPPRRLVRRSYEHHLCHAAAACLSSPFSEATCAVVDGFGEDSSTNFYHYRDGRLTELDRAMRAPSAASLGMFYALICDMCGFDMHLGEEWKVMGLAPYGAVDDELYRAFDRLIEVDGLTLRTADRAAFDHYYTRWRSGEVRVARADLAHTGQRVFEDKLFRLLNNLAEIAGASSHLVLGGGCGLNSSATGKLVERTAFSDVYVFCAPADDGNAVGAALLAYQDDHRERVWPPRIRSPYLGSSVHPETLGNLVRFGGPAAPRHIPGSAPSRAAELLAQGKIIAWFRGPAEFGPRALGNRSILAHPGIPDIKDQINARVKFREEFRPLAPSILHDHGPAYFDNYQESPYMERTLRFRDDVKTRVPGVVHVDGTGRLQTVKREWNEPYWALITRFHELTGLPLVLNTSFNVMGKPIVHSVEDALAAFFTTGLDALFIEDWVLEK